CRSSTRCRARPPARCSAGSCAAPSDGDVGAMTLSTRQRAFTLAAPRALGRDAGRFCQRQALGGAGDEMARVAVALGGTAQQRREAETLARPPPAGLARAGRPLPRPQPSGLHRSDRSWYVAPPRAGRDEAAAHLARAAWGHLVPMDDAG